MKTKPLALLLMLAASSANAITLLNAYVEGNVARAGGSEIVSYTTQDNTLLATVANAGTSAFGVQVMTFSSSATLSERAYIDYSATFGATANISSISSVAADPSNRGFGVARLFPRRTPPLRVRSRSSISPAVSPAAAARSSRSMSAFIRTA